LRQIPIKNTILIANRFAIGIGSVKINPRIGIKSKIESHE
jgi:hypothetical protein